MFHPDLLQIQILWIIFCILCLFPRPQPFVVASRHVQHAPPVRNLTVTNICDKTLFNSPKNTE